MKTTCLDGRENFLIRNIKQTDHSFHGYNDLRSSLVPIHLYLQTQLSSSQQNNKQVQLSINIQLKDLAFLHPASLNTYKVLEEEQSLKKLNPTQASQRIISGKKPNPRQQSWED